MPNEIILFLIKEEKNKSETTLFLYIYISKEPQNAKSEQKKQCS